MNKDKIREIRDEWGKGSSVYNLCDALLEEDDEPGIDFGADQERQRWIEAVRRSSCIEQLCAKMGVTDE